MALATEGTACTSIVSTEKPGEKPTVTTNSQLMRRATSCPDLEQALKEEIRARLALMMQERGNADEDSWGVAGSGGASSADAGASSAGGPASETGGSGGGSSDSGGSAGPGIAPPGAYTGTNTQVAGVDEADFVKTDGQRIYQLREQMLHVARAWPVAELSLQSSAQIEGTPLEMFLVGDAGSADQKLVVYSMVDGTSIYAQAGLEPPRHD
ncbi:MAG: beta-propeller domain-containing protein, partial [Polyangiaceae bacterium]|nr:beta-propeller domain-containing protein [Polyangiaceae bacterium]